MKHIDKRCWIACGVIVAVVGSASHSWLQADETEPDPASAMNDNMGKMDEAYRKLRRTVADASLNAESLQMLAVMQQSAAAVLNLVPAKADRMAEPEKARFVLDYKRQIVTLIIAMLDVEEALLKPDSAKAQQAFRKLAPIKRKGHSRFQDE